MLTFIPTILTTGTEQQFTYNPDDVTSWLKYDKKVELTGI